jgi:uncharacterized membrane protein (DUF485 family)
LFGARRRDYTLAFIIIIFYFSRQYINLKGEEEMLHKPVSSDSPDHAIAFKTRIGVYIFIFYALIYAGFVAINLLKPVLMEKSVLFGLNLAVIYGFGLIILALILALVYNHLCARKEKQLNLKK